MESQAHKPECEILIDKINEEEKLLAVENKISEDELRGKYERGQNEALDIRYDRLMKLLSKSEFYSQFILEKIRSDHTSTDSKKLRRKKQKLSDKSIDKVLNESSEVNINHATSSQEKFTSSNMINSQEKNMSTNDNKENIDKDECSQPRLFENGTLRPYQLDGFRWLMLMYENGVNSILADEMGLGKTIQCIALLCHLIDKGVQGPFIVVAPLSTLPNWLIEFTRFAPQIPTILYHGPESERKKMSNEFLKPYKIEGCQQRVCSVVFTSYEVVIKDRKKLGNILWRYLIVDEGHRIKNYKCLLFRSLCLLNTSNRLILTGTPLQNNLSELWSLLNFLLPEIFDSLDVFESWFQIADMMDENADEKIIQQEKENHIISTMHKILNPFLLRRVKADVDFDIPAKKELLVYTPMTPFQLELYKATLSKDYSYFKESNKEEKEVVKYNSKGRPIRRNSNKMKNCQLIFQKDNDQSEEALEEFWRVFSHDYTDQPKRQSPTLRKNSLSLTWNSIMMQCRKIVNHPYLVSYPLNSQQELKIDDDILLRCGKLQVLDQLLKELKCRDHKVLLFSQMSKMLNIIEDYLSLRPQFKYKRLDGQVKLEDRRADIAQFNEDKDLFLYLLTTRAGGLGINLTSADTVIIYDSDWNPQQDLQAQDRCHRIGQTRPVLVLRLIAASTVDERMVERATAKRKLEKLIMKEGKFTSAVPKENNPRELLDTDELLKLLQQADHHRLNKVSTGTGVFTKEEINSLLDRRDMLLSGQPLNNNIENFEGVYKVISQSN